MSDWPRTYEDNQDAAWFSNPEMRRKYPEHVRLWEQHLICGCGTYLTDGDPKWIEWGICESCYAFGSRTPRPRRVSR